MLVDDLIDIGAVFVGIPNRIRVDDDDGALAAAIHTTGGIDSHTTLAGDVERLRAPLSVMAHLGGVVVFTAHVAIIAAVGAEKHMAFVIRHTLMTAQ